VRIAIAAAFALLVGVPALAGGASSGIHIGLVVTGSFASPLTGTWDSRGAAQGAVYHFVVSGASGVVYALVSLPLPKAATIAVTDVLGSPSAVGRCDLRLGGVIYSLQEAPGAGGSNSARSYEMRYSIQSVDAVASANFDDCKRVAASYLSDIPAAERMQSLFLSRASDGRLVDAVTGTEYTRSR
jgi:hypothetical protein